MNQPVLIAFATKYGATAEIAEKIAEILRGVGLTVDVKLADEVHDLSAYQAVVLGSAVYAGQWRKEAAEFLKNNEKALAQRPTWLFSSGPTGEGDPVELMKGWRFPEALLPIAERIQPREIVLFHGVLDMQKMNFAERLLIRGMKAPTGDFREWDSIEAWAQNIAQTLQAMPA